MFDKTLLAATRASSKNPEALAALALVALSLAEPDNSRLQSELDELIDKWGRTLQGVDPIVIEGLTAELKVARVSLDALAGPLKQAG